MKEETKRKIGILIAGTVFLLGVWGVLTRKDSIEKNVGSVFISDGIVETAITGNRVEVNRNGKISKYEYPDIKSEADRIYKMNASAENSGNMKISYNKEFYGDAQYCVYDSDFNEVYVDQPSLNIPAETDKVYYISISVVWGSEKQNVKMIYYFAIQT